MEDFMNAMDQPEAPDVEQVLRHNSALRNRHVAGRLAIGVPLFVSPFVLYSLGVPDSFFTMLPLVPGGFVLIFLALRLIHGRRLGVCRKVLHTYPLEYRTRVERKAEGDRNGEAWKYLGTIHTVKLSSRGQHGAPRMRAVNASTVRRWPKVAEDGGAWFAGDPAFGGVMIVPGSNDMLFMQPASWAKFEKERAQADPARIARAQQAGISQLLERDPRIPLGL
ncbi:hypothetical protein [Streptomyces sp. NPDC048650]|uniref:hypothetical protein n=1 Tax=unclassified Streptomyces TaxID=2593676 RepID=UPI003721551C